ncbi:MAG: BON domain-containing protein [Acidobacteria bacterium]|nr:BON domain-containing protein [Acidobacteriota bacterium]
MKKFTLITLVAVFGAALIGCQPAATTNANMKANMATANSNTAVVINTSNTSMGMNTNMSSRYSSNMSRADYERSTDYTADQSASTIGQGADDKWIWFKTKAALATVNNVRDSTVNVDVVNGVITLKGTVASKEEADKAVAAAKGIEGQKGIKNELKVNASDSLTNQTVTTGGSEGEGKKANSNHK